MKRYPVVDRRRRIIMTATKMMFYLDIYDVDVKSVGGDINMTDSVR